MSDDEDIYDDPPRNVAEIRANNSSSVSSRVEVNKHLPYIWFNGVLSALSFGLAVCGIILAIFLILRTNVSENHWRTLEGDYGEMYKAVQRLEKENADRRK